MVSTGSPPVPLPVQVPPGHVLQQIVDERGTLRHVILSPAPATNVGPAQPPPPLNGVATASSSGQAGVLPLATPTHPPPLPTHAYVSIDWMPYSLFSFTSLSPPPLTLFRSSSLLFLLYIPFFLFLFFLSFFLSNLLFSLSFCLCLTPDSVRSSRSPVMFHDTIKVSPTKKKSICSWVFGCGNRGQLWSPYCVYVCVSPVTMVWSVTRIQLSTYILDARRRAKYR